MPGARYAVRRTPDGVTPGAPALLLTAERRRFLNEEWPRVQQTIHRLGLTPDDLLAPPAAAADDDKEKP